MILLPKQPDSAGAFGEQIFTRKAQCDGKALSALADQHNVAGMFHDGFGNKRNILDVTDAADGSGATRWAVHAAGVEFDHPFFVGKAAESDRVVVRIILRSLYHAESCIQSVAAAFQESEGVVEIIDAIVRADDDRALVRAGLLDGRRGRLVLCVGVLRIETGGQRGSDCRTQKSATIDRHEFSVLGKRPEG